MITMDSGNNRVFKAGKSRFFLGKKSYIMGVLNVTPDSFSDGGKWANPDSAITRALEIQSQGADILDIGGQSTRPGHEKVPWEVELERIAPVLGGIKGKIHIPVSVDTFYPEVAQKCLEFGIEIVNDVTGFKNHKMFEAVSGSDCGLIIMHDGTNNGMTDFFRAQTQLAGKYNIDSNRICLDPGIGFGKSYEENLFILGNVGKFRVGEYAVLVGASRKRVIAMSCGNPPVEERLFGTIAAHSAALLSGADIVRVHDVKEAVQAARVIDEIKGEIRA